MIRAATVWFMAAPNSSRRVPHLRLKQLRVNAGMSPNELAYRIGVSGKTIRMAEAGFIPTPRVQYQIATAFDLKPLDLWPLDRDRQRPAAPALASRPAQERRRGIERRQAAFA